MSIPLINRSPNSRQYVYALAAAWNLGVWMPDPDWALAQDPEVWEKFQRDPVIKHAIEQRLHTVASQDPNIQPGGETPADDRAAKLYQAAHRYMTGWPIARYHAAKVAMLGRWYGFVEGKRIPVALEPGGPILRWWVPTGIREIDRRRIQFVPYRRPAPGGKGEEYGVRTQMWSLARRDWVDIDPEQLITIVFDDEEARLGHGRGLMGAIYFYHYARGVLLREGLAGAEKWAQGLTIAKLDGFRPGSQEKDNAAHRRAWLDTIEKMRARHALVFEKSDEVEVMWPQGSGWQIVKDLLEYLDRGITQLILGSVLPTGGGGDAGSFARSKVEQDSTSTLLQFDRRLLDEAFSRDLIGRWWRLNAANLRVLGLRDARQPEFRSIHVEKEDPKAFVEMAEIALRCGAKIKTEEFYRRAGLEEPKPGDAVIEQAKPEPAFGGDPFGGGGGAAPGGADAPVGEQKDTASPADALLKKARERIAERIKSGGASVTA